MSSSNPTSSTPRSKTSTKSAFAVALASAVVLVGCPHETGGGGGSDTAIVIGLQSENLGSDAKSAHVTATVAGQTVADQTIAAIQGTAISFSPTEVKVAAPAGQTSGKLDVKVEVLAAEGSAAVRGAPAILTRLASAQFVPGQTKLLRMRLEQRCVNVAVSPGGAAFGPSCVAPTTCVAGRCVDSNVAELEPYGPNWPTDVPDICRPAGAGAPEVIVGTGQTDYNVLADGATLQAELGPQGGHHIWIAVRMRNLRQSGSTTTITGQQPGGAAALPTAFVFTFDRDEGGYCKLYGLRYQLDNGGVDYMQFLGKPFDVTVEVKDSAGLTAKATKHINLDTKLIGQ